MFSKLGAGELILILVIALIVIGPAKLPKLAKSIGKALGNAKKYMRDVTDEIKEVSDDIADVKKDLTALENDIKQPAKNKKEEPAELLAADEEKPAISAEELADCRETVAAEAAEPAEAAAEASEATEEA